MPIPKLAVFAFVTVAALGAFAALAEDPPALVVDPAIAGMTVDQKVEARRAGMKEDGMLLRGAADATGQAAVDLTTKVLQNFTNFPALFADGATNANSHALPLIWEEFDKFTAIIDKGKTSLTAMRQAAIDSDTATYLASFKTLGGVCGECHESYRAKPQ
ncbi:MAG: cytochrome c [Devosia nanyangense]|uniref:Cytochrome c n=1 Tax=Devosia nanyangense TaxID=1228055 RepID=A0A933NXV7_9HYPH|nr:cytochrome c [Devosia nanyangense]